MGELLGVALRVFLMWLRNRFDPEMIKFREIRDVRKAKEAQIEEIERAVADDDTAALSDIWRRLSAQD